MTGTVQWGILFSQGDWNNWDNWLKSPQGLIFYLVLLMMIGLVPILVVLRRRLRTHKLARFAAVLIWLGLGSLPVVLAALFGGALIHLQDVAWGFFLSTGVTYILGSAVPLFVGTVVLAVPKSKARGSSPPRGYQFKPHEKVRILSNRFREKGAPFGSIGYVIEKWADNLWEVEVSRVDGTAIARFVVRPEDIELAGG